MSFLLSLSLMSELSYGQGRRKKEEGGKLSDQPAKEINLWRSMLGELADECPGLTPEKNRPLALAEVADVFWLIDKEVSKDRFVSALDSALELKREDRNRAIRSVLSLAARRDADLSRKLIDRLNERTEKQSDAGDVPFKVALDLVESSPNDAARFAENLTGFEQDKNGVAWLLFQIARRDLNAAESFYAFYLNKLVSNPNALIGDLIWFAGFAFGYAESYGFQNNVTTKMIGFSLKESRLKAKPALASKFLIFAFDKTRKTIDQARVSPPQAREFLGNTAVYAINYLSPEVERYLPSAMGEWNRLWQEALSLSPASQDEAARKIQEINSQRATAQDATSNSGLDSIISSNLAEAEKAAGECQRDRAYASAAFFMGGAKDFNKALNTAELIKDIALRKNMIEFIHYNMCIKATEAGELNEASEHVKYVSNSDQLALLYVKMANVALRQKDTARAVELLTETKRLADKSSDPMAKARNYLAAAALYAQFDMFETESTLREAIKAANQAKATNLDSLRVMIKVNIQCPGEKDDRWLGGADSPERFSIYSTLSLFSKQDFIGATSLARNLEDAASRIRALLSILKTAIEGHKEKSVADAAKTK